MSRTAQNIIVIIAACVAMVGVLKTQTNWLDSSERIQDIKVDEKVEKP